MKHLNTFEGFKSFGGDWVSTTTWYGDPEYPIGTKLTYPGLAGGEVLTIKSYNSEDDLYYFSYPNGNDSPGIMGKYMYKATIIDELNEAAKKKPATVQLDIMDVKSKTLRRLLKKYKVKLKSLNKDGEFGMSTVELSGNREDLESLLYDYEQEDYIKFIKD